MRYIIIKKRHPIKASRLRRIRKRRIIDRFQTLVIKLYTSKRMDISHFGQLSINMMTKKLHLKNEKMKKMAVIKRWMKLTQGLLENHKEDPPVEERKAEKQVDRSAEKTRKSTISKKSITISAFSGQKLKYTPLERWTVILQKILYKIQNTKEMNGESDW